MSTGSYRGRLAPTPTGYLHLGHARTFHVAEERARAAGGVLVYREEDLDPQRCRAEFVAAAREDLRWCGLRWEEGPDVGGPHGPYTQSQRMGWYREVWARLRDEGWIYPSPHSRKEVAEARARENTPESPPDDEQDAEPLFPLGLRAPAGTGSDATEPGALNWRFRVPEGRVIGFHDAHFGPVTVTTQADIGDFLVWRRDGVPSYEFAVVADDRAMQITEVVRGADLLRGTARQLLLYEALGWEPPAFYHVPLLRDADGKRLAKRTAALSLRALRERGVSPEELRNGWWDPPVAWTTVR